MQRLLSSLIIPSLPPWLWVRQTVARDSGYLITPFLPVASRWRDILATPKESSFALAVSLPSVEFLHFDIHGTGKESHGRNHTVPTLSPTPAMLCLHSTVGFV